MDSGIYLREERSKLLLQNHEHRSRHRNSAMRNSAAFRNTGMRPETKPIVDDVVKMLPKEFRHSDS
jgi:hypothetical protein